MKFQVLIFSIILAASSLAHSQSLPFPRFSIVPTLTPGKTAFAYMKEQADGSENLYLAHLDTIQPDPLATWHSQLFTYDGLVEDLVTLDASPDNQILRAFSAQVDISFMDLNNRFFDMNNGTLLGFVNEHRFSGLNKSLHPSQRLADFQEQELGYGVDPEVVADYDYSVDTESGNFDLTGFQWNTDGTVSITYQLEVYSFGLYLGDEEFTINFTVSSSGITIESYGNIKTVQSDPLTFPVGIDPGDFMTVWGSRIRFPIVYHFGTWQITLNLPRQADKVGATIPARYRVIFD